MGFHLTENFSTITGLHDKLEQKDYDFSTDGSLFRLLLNNFGEESHYPFQKRNSEILK